MSGQNGPEKLAKSAFGVVQRFVANLKARYPLSKAQIEAMVVDALKQHGDHLAIHGIVQKSIDAFKLTCWLGGSLLKAVEKNDKEKESCDAIFDAMIATLREFMVKETNWHLVIPKSCMILLKSLLVQERIGNAKHGIWMNGLYMSFHCSIKSWREGQAYKAAVM